LFLTCGVIYEFLRVVTDPRVYRSPTTAEQVNQFIRAILTCNRNFRVSPWVTMRPLSTN